MTSQMNALAPAVVRTGLRPAFPDATAIRTYASHQNALKALNRAAAKLGVKDILYVIASTGTGRFFPIVLPRESEVQIGIAMAHNGVCMLRH